jgi:cyclophilin family peptidyl-prolyl cis-trans isomerase
MKKLLILISFHLFCFSGFSQTLFPDIVMETSLGNIRIRLYDSTSLHSKNFVKLVNEGYYNGQLFHRVISNFMIQTGDDKSKNAPAGKLLGEGGKTYTIPAEFHTSYYHKKGVLAAARTSDDVNPRKESSGSQFYIVEGKKYSLAQLNQMVTAKVHKPFTPQQIIDYTTVGGTPFLDNSYTVLGEVIEGLEIVDTISLVATDKNDRPLQDIKIIKMYTIPRK